MSQVCQITQKKPMRGHNVSHSNVKTPKTWNINLKSQRFYIPELDRWVRLKVSASGIKTLTKLGGLTPFLLKTSIDKLDPDLRPLKKALQKQGQTRKAKPKQ